MSDYCEYCYDWHDGDKVLLCPKHAAVDDLLAALKEKEWEYSNTYNGEYCIWCSGEKPEHESDCPRQAAIAKAEPK